MGVPEYRNGCVPSLCLAADAHVSLFQTVAVPVGHEDPAPFQLYDSLIGSVRKEIIISRNSIEGRVREFAIDELASLEVPCVQNSVVFFFRGKDP